MDKVCKIFIFNSLTCKRQKTGLRIQCTEIANVSKLAL